MITITIRVSIYYCIRVVLTKQTTIYAFRLAAVECILVNVNCLGKLYLT